MTGTWHSLRCCGRFDGLAIVGHTRTEHFAHATHRAAAPRPRAVARPAAPPPAPVRPRMAPPTKTLMVVPSKARRLRAELATLRAAPGREAAQRRAAIKRQLEQLASKENHR